VEKIIPTVKTWCLRKDLSERQLLTIHQGIVKVLASFPETGVKDERDMLNLFPKDRMAHGLGSEIKIEITDLPLCEKEIRDRIAFEMGIFVKNYFPVANVYCTAKCVDPKAGVWSSK
jgi:hypothetical protein